MNQIINDIKEHTPKHLDGYYYIKTQKIYIPFSRLTIHCIEKDIFSLDPVFESVMMLIAEGMTVMKHIANVLGMHGDVFNEAVMDMAQFDYVSISEGKIILTDKGKNALKANMRIERKRIDLQNVFVDLITGKVYDADITYINPKGKYIPLEPVININNEYFSEHFKEIKDLHKIRQKQYQINENAPVEKELEKITGYEQSIVYVEKELHIYKSIASDELQFRLNCDDVEDSYLTQFFKQFKQELINGNRQFFFERINKNFEYSSRFTPDLKLLNQTEKIRNILLSSVSNDEKEEAFLQKHYALNDCEYMSFITNSSRFFKFDYILIVCSDYINTLLLDSFCSQLKALSEDIPVFIVYDDENKYIKESVDYFFPKKERSKKLYLFPETRLNNKLGGLGNFICYYPKMITNITQYTAITEFEYKNSLGKITYSVQIYDFDEKTVKAIAEEIIGIFPQIKECLEIIFSKKPVPQNTTSKSVKSSNFSKLNKTCVGYRKKHSQRHRREKLDKS